MQATQRQRGIRPATGVRARLAAALALVALAAATPLGSVASAQSEDTVTGRESGLPPAIGSVGIAGGFPSYQTVALQVSVQAQYLGLQLKASWTAAGPYVGIEARGYPPVPFAVPLYLGLGAGFYGGNTTLFGVAGAHVPLGEHLRLDLEGGVARVPLLDRSQLVPYVSLGVSYAFVLPDLPAPAERDAGGGSAAAGGGVAPGCQEPTPPDEGALRAALKRTVRDFLESARATYGSVYADLEYRYDITGTSVRGSTGTVTIHYRGSVRNIASGERERASGSARATFAWTGCGWTRTGIDY